MLIFRKTNQPTILLLTYTNFFVLLSMAYQPFVVYLKPNPPLLKDSSGTIQPIAWKNKEVHAFPKGISPKVNKMARLEFELVAQHFSHYATPYLCPIFVSYAFIFCRVTFSLILSEDIRNIK